MTNTNVFKSMRLIAPLFALSFGAPLWADTSAQDCAKTLANAQMSVLTASHATIETSVLIDAPATEVWPKLTDFEAMPDWSTGTLQGMTGDIRDGGQVVISFLFGEDENGKPILNEIPHTLIYEEGVKFGWSDPFPEGIGGGQDNHIYKVEACGDKTLFTQSDAITGNPYAANFAAQLMPMYQLFNAELKTAAEQP